jgi:hypothetical protein
MKTKLILLGIILITLSSVKIYFDKYQRALSNARRWETNFTILQTESDEIQKANHSRVIQMEFTLREFERLKADEISFLQQQLKNADIKIKRLEHALSFATRAQDTLIVNKIDSVLINCLKDTVLISFQDTFSLIDVRLYPDLSASVVYSVESGVAVFIYAETVPYRTKDTRLGNFIQNTAMSSRLTRWAVKKKVIYKSDVISDNPNLIINNQQSLRIIKTR